MGLAGGHRDWLILGAVLAMSAIFLFVDARTAPIVLWDESRNVVNALEMRRTGPSLVTTYDSAPDLWNTKPPLLIWLMTASMALFGPSEWALRLPSALAALGTIALVVLLVRRVTGSMGTAATAGIFVLLSPAFFGEHGARTADYDALLLFLVTAYLALLFQAVHKRTPRLHILLGTGLLIAAGVLTKSTAGLIPGVGVAVWLLLTRRLDRLWSVKGYALMAASAALPVLLFFVARELQSPGYLEASWHNDMAGRFRHGLIGREDPPWFYLGMLSADWFVAGPVLIALPLALRYVRGKSRALLLYSLCVAGCTVAVLTFASTKHVHYALPALPWLAIAAAILLRGVFAGLRSGIGGSRLWFAGAVVVAGGLLGWQAATGFDWRYRAFPDRQFYTEALYGELFTELSSRGIARIEVVDRGMVLEGKPHYVPLLRAYQLMWQERGVAVRHHAEVTSVPQLSGIVVASCHLPDLPLVAAMGAQIDEDGGCVAVRLPPNP